MYKSILSVVLVLIIAGCANSPRPPVDFPAIATADKACRPLHASREGTRAPAEQTVDPVVVTADPDDADTLAQRGFGMSLIQRRDEAIGLFNLALARASSNEQRGEIYWSYGWALFNLREHACALARFDQARALNRLGNIWVDYTLAVTYWQLGQRETALDWFAAARARAPGCWAAPQSAARCVRIWQPQEKRALGELFYAARQRAFAEPTAALTPATGVLPKRQAPPRMEP